MWIPNSQPIPLPPLFSKRRNLGLPGELTHFISGNLYTWPTYPYFLYPPNSWQPLFYCFYEVNIFRLHKQRLVYLLTTTTTTKSQYSGAEKNIPIYLTSFFFFFFWSYHVACKILVPWPGIEPMPPALEAQSLNHWTAREVLPFFFWSIFSEKSYYNAFLFSKNKLYLEVSEN